RDVSDLRALLHLPSCCAAHPLDPHSFPTRRSSDLDTFNFIVAIMYTQLFNLLCDRADDVHGGRLPYHVRLLLDEFANIGQIPKLDRKSTRLNSSHVSNSYAVFCLKKKDRRDERKDA